MWYETQIRIMGNANPKYALSAGEFFITLGAFNIALAFVFPVVVAISP